MRLSPRPRNRSWPSSPSTMRRPSSPNCVSMACGSWRQSAPRDTGKGSRRATVDARAPQRRKRYGAAEVQEAADAGASERLRVSDAVVRNPGIEEVGRTLEAARGTVLLVRRPHEAGQKVERLGGIAARLRF